MNNERYLVVSYLVFFCVSLGLAGLTYAVLGVPMGKIAEEALGNVRGRLLKRALPASLTLAALAAFVGITYNYTGCSTLSYEQVVGNRYLLVTNNYRQVQNAADWMVWSVFLWAVVALLCLLLARKLGRRETRK